jgi:hypothetical protein
LWLEAHKLEFVSWQTIALERKVAVVFLRGILHGWNCT